MGKEKGPGGEPGPSDTSLTLSGGTCIYPSASSMALATGSPISRARKKHQLLRRRVRREHPRPRGLLRGPRRGRGHARGRHPGVLQPKAFQDRPPARPGQRVPQARRGGRIGGDEERLRRRRAAGRRRLGLGGAAGWLEALNRDFRHQLTAVGSPARELHVAEEGGGVAVVTESDTTLLPLPVAGLLSAEPYEVVAGRSRAVGEALVRAGCTLNYAFMTLSLLALV